MADPFIRRNTSIMKKETFVPKTPNITISKKTLSERHGIKTPQKKVK